MDVVVVGVDARARALCEDIVASEVALLRGTPGLSPPVVAACTTALLPPERSAPVVMVTVEQLTESEATSTSALLGGLHAPPPDGPEPSATISRTLPFSDVATCERVRTQLEADDETRKEEWRQATARFHALELASLIEHQTRMCQGGPSIPPAEVKRACDDATERRSKLEERGRRPPDPPLRPVGRCTSR
jgi:hypothetical protein